MTFGNPFGRNQRTHIEAGDQRGQFFRAQVSINGHRAQSTNCRGSLKIIFSSVVVTTCSETDRHWAS